MNYVDTSHLPASVMTMIENDLESGERITWVEQPIPSRLAKSTLPIVIFGIPWTAFAVFWVFAASSFGSHTPGGGGIFSLFKLFPLFGLPFILIGLAMLSSPYWAKRSAAKSAYVITDRRAIIFTSGWRGSIRVRSFAPQELGSLTRKQNPDGSGDVIFTTEQWRDSDGDRRSREIGFVAVRDVKNVEALLRTLSTHTLPRVA